MATSAISINRRIFALDSPTVGGKKETYISALARDGITKLTPLIFRPVKGVNQAFLYTFLTCAQDVVSALVPLECKDGSFVLSQRLFDDTVRLPNPREAVVRSGGQQSAAA